MAVLYFETFCSEIVPAFAVRVVAVASTPWVLMSPVTVMDPAVEVRVRFVTVEMAPMLILPPEEVTVWLVPTFATTPPWPREVAKVMSLPAVMVAVRELTTGIEILPAAALRVSALVVVKPFVPIMLPPELVKFAEVKFVFGVSVILPVEVMLAVLPAVIPANVMSPAPLKVTVRPVWAMNGAVVSVFIAIVAVPPTLVVVPATALKSLPPVVVIERLFDATVEPKARALISLMVTSLPFALTVRKLFAVVAGARLMSPDASEFPPAVSTTVEPVALTIMPPAPCVMLPLIPEPVVLTVNAPAAVPLTVVAAVPERMALPPAVVILSAPATRGAFT